MARSNPTPPHTSYLSLFLGCKISTSKIFPHKLFFNLWQTIIVSYMAAIYWFCWDLNNVICTEKDTQIAPPYTMCSTQINTNTNRNTYPNIRYAPSSEHRCKYKGKCKAPPTSPPTLHGSFLWRPHQTSWGEDSSLHILADLGPVANISIII